MYKLFVFDFLHINIIFIKSPAKISFHLQEALKIFMVCAHILGCQLKHSFHGISEHYIYSLYMGTCEHDIKNAYKQLITKTLKALLTKQTKIMHYSDKLML